MAIRTATPAADMAAVRTTPVVDTQAARIITLEGATARTIILEGATARTTILAEDTALTTTILVEDTALTTRAAAAAALEDPTIREAVVVATETAAAIQGVVAADTEDLPLTTDPEVDPLLQAARASPQTRRWMSHMKQVSTSLVLIIVVIQLTCITRVQRCDGKGQIRHDAKLQQLKGKHVECDFEIVVKLMTSFLQ